RHRDVDAEFGHQAGRAVERARSRGPGIRIPEEDRRRAREAVTFARDHALEREAVVARTEIEKQALWRGWGLTTYGAIQGEIDRRIRTGELLEIDRGRGPEITSREMLELERVNLERVRAGRGTQRPGVGARGVEFQIRGGAGR